MAFFTIPITLDAETLIEEVFAELEERFPGWEPNPGNPEVWLVRAMVYRLIVPLAQIAADVPGEIFDRYGEQIIGLPRIEAVAATVTSTWKVIDAAGPYTIPAGTQVDIGTGSEPQGFRTVNEVIVPGGSEETEAGEVVLEAIEPGVAGNDLSGPSLVDALSFIAPEGIALVGETAGGTDAENPLEYLNRLSENLKTLAPRPIIASDVEILARNIAGVARAAVLDNFDPEKDDPDEPETWATEKTTTIVPQDAEGKPVSAAIKEALEAYFAAKREANFVFHCIDATYTALDCKFTVVPTTGFSQEAADAATVAAIEAFLDPAKWGQLAQDEKAWKNSLTLRYQDLVTIVNEVAAVDHYTKLEIGPTGKLGTVDLTLAGAAALPEPGALEAV